jgi:hypothetical protein
MPTYTHREVKRLLQQKDREAAERAGAAGLVVLAPPARDYGITRHSSREVTVHAAASGKRRRKFTGRPRRHCSGCPFPEGCVMCALP